MRDKIRTVLQRKINSLGNPRIKLMSGFSPGEFCPMLKIWNRNLAKKLVHCVANRTNCASALPEARGANNATGTAAIGANTKQVTPIKRERLAALDLKLGFNLVNKLAAPSAPKQIPENQANLATIPAPDIKETTAHPKPPATAKAGPKRIVKPSAKPKWTLKTDKPRV